MKPDVQRKKRRKQLVAPAMTMDELAKLGDGKVGYIKSMTGDQAKEMFPTVEGIPMGITLYALHGADGAPIALTDSKQACLGHAMGDELEVIPLH